MTEVMGTCAKSQLAHTRGRTCEAWVKLPDFPERKPDETEQVFNLGHYEQMQIHLALQLVTQIRGVLNGTDGIDKGQLENLDETTVKSLRRLFASHGTVTVIRHNQED